MERGRQWLQQMADRTELESEIMPGVPVLELAGDRRVLIERHGGVIEYGPERIRVRVSYGTLCICGCGLELTCMNRQQLVITGLVDSVSIQRRCK